MKKAIGWILFGVGIPYFFFVPAVVKGIADSSGNPVFGGMSLQIGIAVLLIGGGWILAHPHKESK